MSVFPSPCRTRTRIKLLGLVMFAPCLLGCAADLSFQSNADTDEFIPANSWKRLVDDAAHTGEIRYFGFIDVTQDRDHEHQYFEAGFARFETPAPVEVLLESFRQPESDTCELHERQKGNRSPIEVKDELALPGYPYRFIGAGRQIRVTVGTRAYARLERISEHPGDAVQYETDVGSLPISIGGRKLGDALMKTRHLRVSSAGAEFPGFSGIRVPPADVPHRFKPDVDGWISADTRFRWREPDESDAMGTRLQIEAGGGGRAVFCAAADDGEFRLPASVRERLGDARIPNLFAYRDAIWFYRSDDALLVVTQSSYY